MSHYEYVPGVGELKHPDRKVGKNNQACQRAIQKIEQVQDRVLRGAVESFFLDRSREYLRHAKIMFMGGDTCRVILPGNQVHNFKIKLEEIS